MTNDLLYNSLLNAELSPLAARIYLELMNNEDLTISDLAKIYAVQRKKIYDCLSELEKLGLIEKEFRFSRKISIKSPSKIISILQQKEFALKSNLEGLTTLLPTLMDQYYDKKSDFIKIYKGRTQLTNLFDLILEENPGVEILGLGDFQTNIEFWGVEYDQVWKQRRISKQIKLRGLTFPGYIPSKLANKDLLELRQMKLLPDKFRSQGLIIVSGNVVTQWNPILPRAIYINDPVFAGLFRSLFEIVWNLV